MEKNNSKFVNIKYDFVKFISSETKTLGNQVIFFSILTILFNIGFITFESAVVNGIRVKFNINYLVIILSIVNLYYFVQFNLGLKIDELNFPHPEENNKVSTLLSSLTDNFGEDIESLQKRRDLILESNITEQEREEKLQYIINKSDQRKEIIDSNKEELNYYLEKLGEGVKYMKFNIFLNNYFPKTTFFSSIAFVLFNLYKTYLA